MTQDVRAIDPRAAASAVAYLDERRARRLGIGAQLQTRDHVAARLGEAVLRYERHVLAWYPLRSGTEARAADGRRTASADGGPSRQAE